MPSWPHRARNGLRARVAAEKHRGPPLHKALAVRERMGAAAGTGRTFRWLKVALGCLAIPATAQPPMAQSVFRIGYLANTAPLSDLENGSSANPQVVAFVDGLRSLGWQDGKNIRIVWRSAEGQYSRLPQLADGLARMPVDVIVAHGQGVYAAARATKTIPIVMVTGYSPVEDGLAKSYAHPGGNVTGITLRAGDTNDHYRTRVELLKEASPGI